MQQQLNQTRIETIDYIQAMLGQLRKMADAENSDVLAYLIEMAYIEAGDILRGERPLRSANNQRNSAPAVPLKTTGKVKFQ